MAGSFTASDFDTTQPADAICLGVKKVQWSPSGQFLAVGSFDQKCRLLNHHTWKPLLTFDHPRQVNEVDIVRFVSLTQKFYKEVDLAEFGNVNGMFM